MYQSVSFVSLLECLSHCRLSQRLDAMEKKLLASIYIVDTSEI